MKVSRHSWHYRYLNWLDRQAGSNSPIEQGEDWSNADYFGWLAVLLIIGLPTLAVWRICEWIAKPRPKRRVQFVE